ncbi:hypothetical protein VTK73DRAFT_1471 [Phialemonium thermophilum]|uniref:Uncharacterized protein n=1 Tax=Phialemonium thermophilum TaxID=223376 RepID=A0ABR3XA22_9PEZI
MWRRSATTKVEGQNKSDIRDDGTVRKFNKDGTSFNMGYLVAGLTTLIVAYTYWLMTGKPQDSAQTSIKRDPGEVQRQLGTNQR